MDQFQYPCAAELHRLRGVTGDGFRLECIMHGHLHTHWIEGYVFDSPGEARRILGDYWTAHLAEQRLLGA